MTAYLKTRSISIRSARLVVDQPPILRKRQRYTLKKVLNSIFNYQTVSVFSANSFNAVVIVGHGTTKPQSSAFIRLISPLTDISTRTNLRFKLRSPDDPIPDNSDIVIVQRTAFKSVGSAQVLISELNNRGIPLVIDTDDAFSMIDKSHPEYDELTKDLAPKKLLFAAAHEIWVSTSELKTTLQNEWQKKTIVVPNGLDERIWTSLDTELQQPATPFLKFLYMGTATHDADFEMILPVLDELARKYKDSFEVTIIGALNAIPERPWLQKIYAKNSTYPLFVNWFLKQTPFDIGLSPLADSAFNRSKSDIKCLDYIAGGIMPVVSDLMPYASKDLDGFIVRAANSSDWYKKLEGLVKDPVKARGVVKEKVKEGRLYITKERTSTRAADILEERLEKLVDKAIS